jgi:protein TonB
VYPEAARQAGVQGKVRVQAVVCKDGSVQGVQVLKSPSPELGTAAADAVRLWKFQPAVKDGKPVAVRYTVTLDVKP